MSATDAGDDNGQIEFTFPTLIARAIIRLTRADVSSRSANASRRAWT
jgi:hypothetical protein